MRRAADAGHGTSNYRPNTEKDLYGSVAINYDRPRMPQKVDKRSYLALLWLLTANGCATQSPDMEKQLREATERLHRLESRSDRLEERVSALELVKRTQASRGPEEGRPAGVPSDLPVVKMEPTRGAIGSDAADPGGETDEPRTLIVGEGARVETKTVSESSGAAASPKATLPTKRTREKGNTDAPKKANGSMEHGNAAP